MPKIRAKATKTKTPATGGGELRATRAGATGTAGGVSKREKRVEKKGSWMNKLTTAYTARTAAAEKQIRIAKGGVAADLDALKLALKEADVELNLGAPGKRKEDPDVMDEDDAGSKRSTVAAGTAEGATGKQKPKPVKQTSRIKNNVSEMIRFQKILQHKQFQARPLQTIQTHLKNTLGADV
ncbi:hypothetical protein HDU96_000880 [Phlyctochytrium bullatum]|nr:hypothetical protein HDU96_000880 [Phlyctochytrium bullatum]